MPPEAGLYTAMAALVACAVFGSSRQLVVVGTSATAALLAGTVAALNPEDAGMYAAYAAALVLLIGLLFVLAGLAKLGFIVQFLPRPVMEGFVLGLASFVAVGQLNKLFGVEKGEGNVQQKLWHVVTGLGEANWWSFAVGLVCSRLRTNSVSWRQLQVSGRAPGSLAHHHWETCLRRWSPRVQFESTWGLFGDCTVV